MKTYFKVITSVILVFVFFSCSEKDIVDLKPINAIASEAAFTTPTLIDAAMNGMYNAASIGVYNGSGGRGYIWGAAFVQQGDNRGEDVINLAGFYQLTYTGTYDANSANNEGYWVDGYRLINRCNVVIEGVTDAVSKGIITATVGNRFIAEARFLRAITHFELLTYFARPFHFTPGAGHLGVPYREVGIDTDAEVESEALKGRNTVAECYTKALADLDFAEVNLVGSTNKFRATPEAAIAFKTRIHLHSRNYSGVITEGNKLLNSSRVNLAPTPEGAFTIANTNIETVFSIQHGGVPGQNPGPNGALAQMYKGRVLVAISPIIWRNPAWLLDDRRRENNVMTTRTSNNLILTDKYKDVTNNSDSAPVIRYAEVLLNMAEAHARLAAPDLATSLTLLNRVRNRSLANPATQAYTSASFANQTEQINAILVERRIEFVCEGRRWSDIHRLQGDPLTPINGVPAKVPNGTPTAAVLNGWYTLGTPYTGPFGVAAMRADETRFLWAIPLRETSINPVLRAQQNPGWQ